MTNVEFLPPFHFIRPPIWKKKYTFIEKRSDFEILEGGTVFFIFGVMRGKCCFELSLSQHARCLALSTGKVSEEPSLVNLVSLSLHLRHLGCAVF